MSRRRLSRTREWKNSLFAGSGRSEAVPLVAPPLLAVPGAMFALCESARPPRRRLGLLVVFAGAAPGACS